MRGRSNLTRGGILYNRLMSLLRRWPVFRQLIDGGDGTGPEAMTARTRALGPRTAGASVARSVCPYCAVGCGQLVFHRDGKLRRRSRAIRRRRSREGHLCPKGAASLRAPDPRGARDEGEVPRAARRRLAGRSTSRRRSTWSPTASGTTRERGFTATRDGLPLMQCANIAHLGGATLDNEENYLIKKLFAGGLGMVAISNQARI